MNVRRLQFLSGKTENLAGDSVVFLPFLLPDGLAVQNGFHDGGNHLLNHSYQIILFNHVSFLHIEFFGQEPFFPVFGEGPTDSVPPCGIMMHIP